MTRTPTTGIAAADRRGGVDYRALVAGSADVSCVATEDGVLCYVSPACTDLFGWDPAELEGRRWDDVIHPDDVGPAQSGFPETPSTRRLATYRFLCGNGSYRWVEATTRFVGCEDGVFVVSALRDITERKRTDVALQRQAFTDPLTGIANRTLLIDRLHQALGRQSRGTGVLAVLYLDLDRFKVINDLLGHRAGDSVLMQMAERLKQHLRPGDTLARLGGDEFVIVAEGVADEAAAVELANRITEAGHVAFEVGGEELLCTLSVGIACTTDSGRAVEDLLQEADLALYRAKELGRDRAEMYDHELRTKSIGRLAIERMLRRAIEERRIVVAYQPVVDLGSRGAVGVEALVRVDDPEHGLWQAGAFLEVAEETGLLAELDALVLADAITQTAALSTAHGADVAVAINVTARHLADAAFVASVFEMLDAQHVPRHLFQIEVTERVLLEASNSAMSALRDLRDGGVQVGLDDFGTGYSSLAHLRHFPLDYVKIDRACIGELGRSDSEEAVVGAIIKLCHALGLSVVAEGVETEHQLRILRELACDRGQGYLFGRPEPIVAGEELPNVALGGGYAAG